MPFIARFLFDLLQMCWKERKWQLHYKPNPQMKKAAYTILDRKVVEVYEFSGDADWDGAMIVHEQTHAAFDLAGPIKREEAAVTGMAPLIWEGLDRKRKKKIAAMIEKAKEDFRKGT